MPQYRVALSEPLVANHVDELRRRLFFLHPALVEFGLEPDAEKVDLVVLTTSEPVDEGVLGARLRRMIDEEVRPQPQAAPEVFWRSSARRQVPGDVFDDMVRDGVVVEVGRGRVSLAQPAVALLDALDALVSDIAIDGLAAREFRYPTLLALDVMQRSSYLSAFPQYLMFVTRPRADVDTYRQISEASRNAADQGAAPPPLLEYCADVELVLPPTMCYHTFQQFAGTPLGKDAVCVTAKGPSFRHESRYHRTMERLADFTIREIVFMGPDRYVRAARDKLRQDAVALVEQLGLTGHCEVATDPFFSGRAGAERSSLQRELQLKHELQLEIAGGPIAVASFNLHYRHFGTAFGILGEDGGPVHTGCVGFGLERLTYAVLCQHGWDPANWPDLIRSRLDPRALARRE
ncbi:hypothetical protein [Melissospora conviva]|uniref:hypothetical protein n=1 Tax=Melissospora conviva TaxID=3388432 RepID=UPI003B784006